MPVPWSVVWAETSPACTSLQAWLLHKANYCCPCILCIERYVKIPIQRQSARKSLPFRFQICLSSSSADLTDILTLLWAGGWSIISLDISSCFNRSVSLWFKLRGQEPKYFYFATVQDTGITGVPVLCTASPTHIQEKWAQTGSSTENQY